MTRLHRSSTIVQSAVIGALIPALCYGGMISVSPAVAEEHAPFDPVFSPATGINGEPISIRLEHHINSEFLETETQTLSASRQRNTDVPESTTTDEVTPRPITSGSGGGLLADLLRLFGLNQDDQHGINESRISNVASMPPPETNTKTATVSVTPIHAARPEPKSTSTTKSDSNLFENIAAWIADNTENAGILDDSRDRSRRASSASMSTQAETIPEPVTQPPAATTLTIARRSPEPTFIDIVNQFFTGGTVDHVNVNGVTKPPSQMETPVIQTPSRRTLEHSENEQAIPVSYVEQATPLVDAAIAKAKRLNIDPTIETGMAVNIAVPASNATPIIEEKLVLGTDGNLGRAIPFTDEIDNHCVRRHSGRTRVCLESLGWPTEIADAFTNRGSTEQHPRAIVRYDAEEATQYRASFPTGNFERIRFHFEYLLGPPTEMANVWVSLFAEPKRKNRVLRWVAAPTDDLPAAILEIREIDDMRWMEFPDKTRGVVRLYRDGAKPIFSMIMNADLRLIEVRNLSKVSTTQHTSLP